VIEIHRRLADGETQRVISEAFGISREAISAIKLGKTLSHLK
jgi:transcriptional regulator with XRE-family HTH domain